MLLTLWPISGLPFTPDPPRSPDLYSSLTQSFPRSQRFEYQPNNTLHRQTTCSPPFSQALCDPTRYVPSFFPMVATPLTWRPLSPPLTRDLPGSHDQLWSPPLGFSLSSYILHGLHVPLDSSINIVSQTSMVLRMRGARHNSRTRSSL